MKQRKGKGAEIESGADLLLAREDRVWGSQRGDGTSIPHDALRQRRLLCANDGTMEDDPGWNQGAMIGWPGDY